MRPYYFLNKYYVLLKNFLYIYIEIRYFNRDRELSSFLWPFILALTQSRSCEKLLMPFDSIGNVTYPYARATLNIAAGNVQKTTRRLSIITQHPQNGP